MAACQGGSRTPPAAKDAGAGAHDQVAPTPVAPPSAPREVTLEAPEIELPHQESFRLLSPGAAPRQALRYRWKPDAAREVHARATIRSRRLSAGAWSEPVAVPPLDEGFAVTPAPGDGGSASLLVRGLPSATPGGDAVARWKALVENKRATIAVDDRGQIGRVTLAEDPGGGSRRASSDEIAQRWLTAAVPLPAEPIGKGARWRVVTVLRSGEAVVKQTAEYTLVQVRKNGWVIDVVNRRVAEQQTMMPAGLPKGTTAELVALFRILEGRVTVAPDLPWPTGSLTAELRVHGRVATPGQPAQEHVTEDTGTIQFAAK
jgi:hypothetical protein